MTFQEPQNLTSIPDMFRYANEVGEGVFIPLLLISLYLIIFLYTMQKQLTAISAATASGFFVSIVAIFLGLMGLVEQSTILITIFAVIVPVIFLYSFGK